MSAASRHPSAFAIRIAPQPRLQGLVALLGTLAAAALIAAFATHWPLLAWCAVLLPFIGWLARRMARLAPIHLRWDGQAWFLAADAVADGEVCGAVEVVFDFEAWMLVRVKPGMRPRWPRWKYLPLARRLVGPEWGRLRATLYSARPEAHPHGA